MPKEIVVERSPDFFDEESGEFQQADSEGLVQVSWNAETGDVQIVTFSRAVHTHETTWEGFYVTLDRYMINQLIRFLRKARNSAFGADE